MKTPLLDTVEIMRKRAGVFGDTMRGVGVGAVAGLAHSRAHARRNADIFN